VGVCLSEHLSSAFLLRGEHPAAQAYHLPRSAVFSTQYPEGSTGWISLCRGYRETCSDTLLVEPPCSIRQAADRRAGSSSSRIFGLLPRASPPGATAETHLTFQHTLTPRSADPSHDYVLSRKRSRFHLLGPGQTDFAGLHITPIKDALSCLNRDVDHCPVAV
jgi:hypothetical protein